MSFHILFYWTEILGALLSVMSIWIVTGALVYLAIERIVRNDYEIEGRVMLITSAFALIVNIVYVAVVRVRSGACLGLGL